MSPLQYVRTVIVSLTLCVSGNSANVPTSGTSHFDLPAELSLEDAVFSEGPILVNLNLEDGEKLLFGVDTGSGRTFLDESLAPKLGAELAIGMPISPSIAREQTKPYFRRQSSMPATHAC